ncbi:DEAD/DEAH box helicase [Jiulongibacter sediminis]|uniref:DEAD/DEAH box helicase n=1 Tax=Jiulongibacter sediminis TaxID=1605367 RepID=A0A0P7C5I2_9BACT|nr:DEAD/DEAH box helicase [Jiulongibacter sediminis]KPM47416.1 DEAD/DEAH box helicase [Jiulongibacter sediminis]TBX22996.1 DEAD/DEAH box helicase [Jiulongibacter sediminis]
MNTFDDFKIKKQLRNALDDLGFVNPTPIQQEAYSVILSGSDFVGIAQTGTGKTFAYLLPILQDLPYAEQLNPRVLILAPTRELVLQIVEQVEKLTEYMSVRVLGVYGGSNNMKTQKLAVMEGADILVATPRRLYDLAISNAVKLKSVKKLVIDEVDIMLDFGYKTQLRNIFELLPAKRQQILFSATMTTYVDELIDTFLINPIKKTVAISGTPLENISQTAYAVPNFYSKVNLLNHLLQDSETFNKVLIFVGSRVEADRLFETFDFEHESSLIHAGKEQNYRTTSIENFEDGSSRILIATDVIARGIDFEKISHVISFDTPFYPENYMHRIGRTGRAEEKGNAILLHTEKEKEQKEAVENLMKYEIPSVDWPEEVQKSSQLTPEEKDQPISQEGLSNIKPTKQTGAAFHEKSAKNSKEKKERVAYEKQLKQRYKKPIRRGDKIQNMKKKKKK